MQLKTKLSGILLVGVLLTTGAASAATFYNSTLAAWAAAGSVTDPSNDATFTYIGNSNLATLDGGLGLSHIGVMLSETTIGQIDRYTARLDFTGLNAGGLAVGTYSLGYAVTFGVDPISGHPKILNRVGLASNNDTFINTTVTKQVYLDAAHTNLLTTLTSTNNSTAAFDYPVGVVNHFYVVDTFSIDATGLLLSSTNTYDTRLPEPVSLSLFSIGLAGIGFVRRRSAKAASTSN